MEASANWIDNLIWFLLFAIFMIISPRLMLTQIIWKLEESAERLEAMASDSVEIILEKIKKKKDKKARASLRRFLDFFVIPPVSLDPYGIIKKFEHLLQNEKRRLSYFVRQIAGKIGSEEEANIMMGLSASITLNQYAKIMRHYVELVKKTKNVQLAFLIQMNVPLLERLACALHKGVKALVNGWPIGDTIGPLIAAELIGNAKVKELEEDTVVATRKIQGKTCFIVKAKGPGGRTGRPGKLVEKLAAKNKIAKIITIDAAAKLEGEKTGSVAEGVGVAIGGIGVEKNYIEEVAVKKNIPLDSIVIKMSQEEAITLMKKEILEARQEVHKLVNEAVKRTRGRGKIIIVGVGNTSGVGNNKKQAEKAIENLKKLWKKQEAKKPEKSTVLERVIGG